MIYNYLIPRVLCCAWTCVFALTLTACNSGDAPQPEALAGPIPPTTPSPAPPPVADKGFSGGYLYGELHLDASGSTYPIQILLSEDGRFRALQVIPRSL